MINENLCVLFSFNTTYFLNSMIKKKKKILYTVSFNEVSQICELKFIRIIMDFYLSNLSYR